MKREELRLIGAREAAQIMCIDPCVVYRLWREDKLDFWCINGTMKTNLAAIRTFQDPNRYEKDEEQPVQ